jgi:hypothetical protein
MSSKHPKAALDDEKAQIEQQLVEIDQKIAQHQEEIEKCLGEKIELDLMLANVEKELNFEMQSAKSISFAPNEKISCQSMSRCNMCMNAVLESASPKISSLFPQPSCTSEDCDQCQQDFKKDNQSEKASMISNGHSSIHTKYSFNPQSCQSIASCSLCRKEFDKPGTTCTSIDCEPCSKMNADPSCKSFEKCSLCMQNYLVPLKTSKAPSESIKSEHESQIEEISEEATNAEPTCKSLGECSDCREHFADPTVEALEVPSEVTKVQSKVSKAPSEDPGCKSIGECSECRENFADPSEKASEITKAQSEVSKASSKLSEIQLEDPSKLDKIQVDPSCKSLASCSACQKGHAETLPKASETGRFD